MSDFDQKIASYVNAILYQKQEIKNTETIVLAFKNCLKRQEESLKNFIEEREKLTELLNKISDKDEKPMEKKQKFDNDVSQSIIKEIKEQDFSNIENKIIVNSSATNYLNVYPVKLPRCPKECLKKIKDIMLDQKMLYYPDQTQIPNQFKFVEKARKIVILKIATEEEIQGLALETIMGMTVIEEVILRIAEGKIRIHYGNNVMRESVVLDWQTSWTLPVALFHQGRVIEAEVVRKPMVIMFENIITERIIFPIKDTTPENVKLILQKEGSVAWEEDAKICFLAARFAFRGSAPHPVWIAITDDEGQTLMNEKVCPRAHIQTFNTDMHGLREADIIGKMDEWEAIKIVRNLVRRKIVVGNGVKKQLDRLRVDIGTLAGVRELSTCYKTQYQAEEVRWSLARLTLVHLPDCFVQFPVLDPNLEIKLIHMIFNVVDRMGIKQNYRDKSKIPQIKTLKNNLSMNGEQTAQTTTFNRIDHIGI